MTMEITAAYYTGQKQFSIERVAVTPPSANEVQIEVAYCGVCGTDMHVFHGAMDARIGHHRVIGHEMSGKIVALGSTVDGLSIGDSVVVRPLAHCGECPACQAGHIHICHHLKFLGLDTDGAFQQRWNVPAHTVHVLPQGIALDKAALVEPVSVACHGVSRANLRTGEDVLVIGGGPIGILLAMVAQKQGANVIISEPNSVRIATAEKLGFKTLNPTVDDISNEIMRRTNNKGADVVFEVSGTQSGVDVMTKAIATRGRIVMTAIHTSRPNIDLFHFFWREIELFGARVYTVADYERAIELVANDAINVGAIITDIGSLETIQQSFEVLETNPSAMKSLIKCSEVV